MIKLDILENQVNTIFLGIGSNLGNKKINIEKAKYYLSQKHLKFVSVSKYYMTPSWPNANNPSFLNIVLKAETKLNPIELLKLCKSIEMKLGRKITPKNSPRKCDIDIIDFNGLVSKYGPILPHNSMHKRNFVLFPLFEIEKKWLHPSQKVDVKSLIFSLPINDIRSIKQI